MNRTEFESEFKKLLQHFASRTANERCIECVACERCTDSTFCRNSKQLLRCHYCVATENAVDCTHCRNSKDLVGCSHCAFSEGCTKSSYLVRCSECSNCTYCFGCVGLSSKDFHILNQPYDRSTYFALTGKLMAELGLQGRS